MPARARLGPGTRAAEFRSCSPFSPSSSHGDDAQANVDGHEDVAPAPPSVCCRLRDRDDRGHGIRAARRDAEHRAHEQWLDPREHSGTRRLLDPQHVPGIRRHHGLFQRRRNGVWRSDDQPGNGHAHTKPADAVRRVDHEWISRRDASLRLDDHDESTERSIPVDPVPDSTGRVTRGRSTAADRLRLAVHRQHGDAGRDCLELLQRWQRLRDAQRHDGPLPVRPELLRRREPVHVPAEHSNVGRSAPDPGDLQSSRAAARS